MKFVLISLVIGIPAHATSIVIVRTDREALIGADGKQIYDNDQVLTVCKIHQVGKVFITASGVRGLKILSFDLLDYAKRAASSKGTVREKAEMFERNVIQPLTATAERLMRDDPVFYERYSGKYFVQVAFVEIENDRPVVVFREFKPEVDSNKRLTLSIRRISCPGNCRDSFAVFLMGEYTAIKKQLDSTPGSLEGDIPSGIKKLIALQIDMTPDWVGHPINILRISKNGAEWIEPQENCPRTTKSDP